MGTIWGREREGDSVGRSLSLQWEGTERWRCGGRGREDGGRGSARLGHTLPGRRRKCCWNLDLCRHDRGQRGGQWEEVGRVGAVGEGRKGELALVGGGKAEEICGGGSSRSLQLARPEHRDPCTGFHSHLCSLTCWPSAHWPSAQPKLFVPRTHSWTNSLNWPLQARMFIPYLLTFFSPVTKQSLN